VNDVRTYSLADQAPAPPVEPPHLPILDAAVSADGRSLSLLTVDGQIWTQVPYTGWNHGEVMPEWQWERVVSPPGNITRILIAGGRLMVICDGQLLRRVIDEQHCDRLWKPHWIWTPVQLPAEGKH
jgi:hypothetical protein